jgi:hypothetical protein
LILLPPGDGGNGRSGALAAEGSALGPGHVARVVIVVGSCGDGGHRRGCRTMLNRGTAQRRSLAEVEPGRPRGKA